MQVRAGDSNVRVASGGSDFCQRPSARQSVANERVPTVVNGERPQPLTAQNLAGRQESAADGMALQCLPAANGEPTYTSTSVRKLLSRCRQKAKLVFDSTFLQLLYS